MRPEISPDEALVQRLPLPLAQLYRRAHNAKSALDRHLTAFYLWEAALKLLASAAVVEYAAGAPADPQIAAALQDLARPSLRHWWGFVRLLVPALADRGDEPFRAAGERLFGKARDDCPRAAGLDALLRETLEGKGGARATVQFGELFNRLLTYRNKELGHGAAGQRAADFYERLGPALLAGLAEVLGRLDVLTGRRLLHAADVRRLASGNWLVERFELHGETARRIESLEVPEADAARLPRPGRLYLHVPGSDAPWRALHPLVVYEAEGSRAFFLNSRQGQLRADYLCYATGEVVRRDELGGEQRELLAQVLGGPVDGAAVEAWAARSRAEEPPTAEAPPDRRTLGEFELISRLGRGGMGVVYRAWQPSLGRQVALKCLLRAGDPKAEARFAREIHALGRVEHPNLVKVFTSGSEGEQWFYAMELVEGADLAAVGVQLASSTAAELGEEDWTRAVSTAWERQRQQEQPLSHDDGRTAAAPPPRAAVDRPCGRGHIAQVVDLVRQAAEAAHALHEAGVIHRDVKPGNIMVSADGRNAVLMDLGLAQLADEAEGRLTRTRQFVGTLRYASPEQVLAAGRMDRRADVYSLGATLWELLTLRPLFGADEQTPTPELMLRIQTTDPQRPRKHNPRVPVDLEAIVVKCLEKDRARRYATAADLAADLGRWQRGEPVIAQPPCLSYLLGKQVRRHWVPLTAAGLVLLAAMIGVIVAFVQISAANAEALANWRQAEQQQQTAEQQAALARRRLYDADMNLARQAWERADVDQVLRLLDGQRPGEGQTDLRGPEWHYLWRRCHGEMFPPLRGHTGTVFALGYSPDGKVLATGGNDKAVRLWDVATRQPLGEPLLGHTSVVRFAVFSPDGNTLATGGFDKTIRLWDVGKRVLRQTFLGHEHTVFDAAFLSAGQELVTISRDGTIRFWDVASGREKRPFVPAHGGWVSALAVSPDGRMLATGGFDKKVVLWDAASGKLLRTLEGHNGTVWGVAFTPNGRALASASFDRTVKLWDPATGAELAALTGHTDGIWALAMSPNREDPALATGGFDKTVRLWDLAAFQQRAVLKGHLGEVRSVSFSPDGRLLTTGALDATVRFWDATTGLGLATHRAGPTPDAVRAAAFTPDGRRLVTGTRTGELTVWDAARGDSQGTRDGHDSEVLSLAFSTDGKLMASGSQDQTVRLWRWDGAAFREDGVLGKGDSGVAAVAFSPDGKVLASGGDDREITLWDVNSRKKLVSFPAHGARVTCLAFTPDGVTLVSGGRDKIIRYWDPATREERRELKSHTGEVMALALTADGRTMASASYDTTVKLWDVAAGSELATLKGHTGPVRSVAFSGDGRILVSGGGDWDRPGELKIWDVAGRQEKLDLQGHALAVSAVALTPDGKRLATADGRGILKLWDVEAEVARAASHSLPESD